MKTMTEQQRKRQKRRDSIRFWLFMYLEMFGAYSLAAAIIIWNWW